MLKLQKVMEWKKKKTTHKSLKRETGGGILSKLCHLDLTTAKKASNGVHIMTASIFKVLLYCIVFYCIVLSCIVLYCLVL